MDCCVPAPQQGAEPQDGRGRTQRGRASCSLSAVDLIEVTSPNLLPSWRWRGDERRMKEGGRGGRLEGEGRGLRADVRQRGSDETQSAPAVQLSLALDVFWLLFVSALFQA